VNHQPLVITVTSKIGQLVGQAFERTGLTDLGSDSWREGLSILVDSLEFRGTVTASGRDDLYRQFVEALCNRLRVIDYVKRHPEVALQRIERPLVILGLPRTGTTVASCLLDQDPARRSLMNWEAGDSIPPATTRTLRNDPRCRAKKAQLDQMAAALQAAQFPIPHWEDADGPTECLYLHNQDFKAFLWEAFMPNSAYADWLMGTDMSSAYAYERSVLQVLQSQAPGVWSLKMPSHAVHIEALLAAFPDVRLVWAHRDPFKATASLLSMQQLSRGMACQDVEMGPLVQNVMRQVRAHVERPLRARQRLGSQRFFDLHYADLMRDPVGQMRALYRWAGDPLTAEVEQAMHRWLQRNPQDRFGIRPYALKDFGITRRDLQSLFEEYLSVFDVELEQAET
jgi:hypothetical protein